MVEIVEMGPDDCSSSSYAWLPIVSGRDIEAGMPAQVRSRPGSKFVIVLLASGVLSTGAVAQTHDDMGLWFAAFGNGKFKSLPDESPLRWWLDTHYRLRDDTGGFNQSIIRPGLGYALGGDHVVWSGYAWVRTAPVDGDVFDEHRFWQQWTYAPSVDNWYFLHRSRFEQRWVETGDDVGLRWREFVRAQWAFTESPQWSLVAHNETFFHLNDTDWGSRAGFDQNRAFLGFGFKRDPEDRARIEFGYMNQFIFRRGRTNEMNHILSINLFY